jgi:hypothetical protein
MISLKRSFLFLLLLTSLITLCGCYQEKVLKTSEPNKDVHDYRNLFELKLYTDKASYKTTDAITIWATLKYIGGDSQIQIWHSNPYISFTISDGHKFNTGGIFDLVLTSTILEKNILYKFDYKKTGGFDANDPNAKFWEKFYAEKDLYLPKGEYIVKVCGAFSINKDDVAENNNLNEELRITVTR